MFFELEKKKAKTETEHTLTGSLSNSDNLGRKKIALLKTQNLPQIKRGHIIQIQFLSVSNSLHQIWVGNEQSSKSNAVINTRTNFEKKKQKN